MKKSLVSRLRQGILTSLASIVFSTGCSTSLDNSGNKSLERIVVKEDVDNINKALEFAQEGKEYHILGDITHARKFYSQALALNSRNSLALSGMGLILIDDGGKIEEGKKKLEKAVTLSDVGPDQFLNLGLLYETRELDFNLAKNCYDEAIKLGGGYDAYVARAELFSSAFAYASRNNSPLFLEQSGLSEVEALKSSRDCYEKALEFAETDLQRKTMEYRIGQINYILDTEFSGGLE